MELIVFLLAIVNGSLIIATGYYTYTSVRLERANSGLEDELTRTKAHMGIMRSDLEDRIKDITTLTMDITTKMEKDSYSDLANLNEKITALTKVAENHAKSFQVHQKFENRVSEKFTSLERKIKSMEDNPSLNRDY
tara:strand:- start:959 stop:1366 length:408 start_codon:yes stop_codon:yes gene_type:complete